MLAGKCISMALAISGARLFTNEITLAISKAAPTSRPLPLSPSLRAEIEHLHYIPCSFNPTDMPSRHLTPADSALSLPYWQQVQTLFGSPQGHSVDLMALLSNVRPHLDGNLLPFFSPFPITGATGVNLFAQDPAHHPSSLFRNPYIPPPPIILVGQLLSFLIFSPFLYPCYSRCLSLQILVAPSLFLRSLLSQTCLFCFTLSLPCGYQPLPALSWDLWVFQL